ncbi:uncharacterized protein MYCFIDRAFT_214726 [Pseudocercospora fijiensis CIRAD86]|uniref:Putative zinc-finger domain-containing protein n=1 Tax=Pseudocercospora fijiensis (strain CIRAD86) TaxID=383855 RepID=M2ZZS1_PSEFD|nr:uncharacterized protein MYCFIDRAFT_214726 [Pseudocercospora fijiensis CIRAD86]EME84409.1 hypothetical protein MYCFIDRAFT_214726 [Pseudocercospora fijiensis CIRAD86]
MSQNIPFLFGQPPAPVHTQHQQNATDTQPQTPTNGAPTPTSQQQMATPQAGLPADFDMSALAGVTPEQFAMIARMIQQGLVPMPPGAAPAAAAAAIPPSAPAATWSKNPPRHSADTPTPQNTSSTAQANGHDVDMDKEEGELEEGEMEDAPKARDFLRTPPKGPRKRSRSPLPRGNAAPADRRGSQQGPAPARPGPQRTSSSAGSAQASRSNGQAPVISQAVSGNTPQPAVGKDAAAKAFLLEMHRNGYNFDQLSREVGDPKTLRRMYQQLGLPLPSSCDSPANQGGVPVAQQPRKTSMPLATKAPTPQNRSEYLAKLQAAKNKKAEASAKSATPPAAPTAASTTETTTVGPRLQPAKPAAAVAAAPPRTGGLTKDKNELLRQKLDKLKAEQAARRQAKQSSDAAAPSSPAVKSDQNAASPMPASRPGLGAGLVEAAARASDEASMNVGPNGFVASQNMAFQALVPSASPTLNRGFGLPGLFTTMLASAQSNDASPQPISSRPASSTPAQNVFAAPSGSTQQPASAIEAARNDSATHNQNFGQSRDVYHDDRYVIEVSSDEEEDDDSMDVDEASEKPRAEKMHFSNSTLKTSRPKLHMPSGGISTTPGTPGVSTPNADLKRKLEEIEEFKRQIAEAERKRQRNGKAKAQAAQEEALVDAVDQVIASSNALASGNATPSEPQQPLETALQPGNQPVTGANPERPSSTSSASARLAREQEKDTLRRRLAELEVQRNQLSSAPTGNATAQPQLASPGIAMNSSEPAPAHSNTVAAPSAFPVNDPNDSDEIDDEDDEDLYGEYTADQIAQPALQPDHIQATSDGPESSSEDDQFEGEGDDVFEPGSVNGMETQEPFSAHPTTQDSPERDVPSTMEASIPGAKTIVAPLVGNDDEMDDEEDLDNLYGEVASAPTAEPAVQTLTDAMASNDDNEEDDSDDAMDTSDASSDSDSSSDDSDDEPESRPDIIQAPHSETVLSAAALLSPGEEVNDDQIDEESDEEAEDTNDAQDMGDTELSVNDDLAPGLQPPMEELDVPTEDYRFHPEFEHTVPGGFKSLTYSHKIDSENTLCPFELSGGSCIDKSCTHQHFRSLALSEHTPARTPAEEKRWKNGLALLVKQLRASNVKDVAAIAHRIAEYRRAFREDPTRVLVGLDD